MLSMRILPWNIRAQARTEVYVVEPTRAQSFRPQEEWNQQQPGANHEYYDSILKRAFAGEPKVRVGRTTKLGVVSTD